MNVDGVMAVATAGAALACVVGFVALRSRYTAPMLVTTVAHGLIAWAVYQQSGLYAPDARGYDERGVAWVAYWNGETALTPTVSAGKEAWPLVLGVVYRLLGHYPSVGLMINIAACTLLVPVIASIAERVGAPARRAAWLTALFPPFLFWGSLLLREALVWLCVAMIVRSLVGMRSKMVLADVTWLVAASTALLWVRGTAAILVVAAGLLALVMTRRKAGGLAIAVTFSALVLAGPLAARFDTITSSYSLERVNSSRSALTDLAASGYATQQYSGTFGIVRALPSQFPRVLAGPFPWEWPAMNPLFAADAVAWLVLLFWTIRGWRRLGGRTAFVMIAPAIAVALALAVTSGNYGTMQRLRLLCIVPMLPVAAAGMRREDRDPNPPGVTPGRSAASLRRPSARSR